MRNHVTDSNSARRGFVAGPAPRRAAGTIVHGCVDFRAGWVLRAVRALVLSAVALGLAVVAHVSAGGVHPDAWTIVVLLGFCALGSSVWLGREASRRQIFLLLIGGQTLLHGAMTVTAGNAGDNGTEHSTFSGTVVTTLQHLFEELTPAHAPMTLAHLAAAALTGLWLAHGERALWDLIGLAAHATRRAVLSLAVPHVCGVRLSGSHPPAASFLVAAPLCQVFLCDTHVRRGPPVVFCAL